MTIKSCLLAPNDALSLADDRLRWPLMGSQKFDGFRCLIIPSQSDHEPWAELLTRNMKPMKNTNLYRHLKELCYIAKCTNSVLDMELYDHDLETFAEHSSILTSRDAPIPSTMLARVFDMVRMEEWTNGVKTPFMERIAVVHGVLKQNPAEYAEAVDHFLLDSPDEAEELFKASVQDGYEGIMLRDPKAPYKHGRATINEHIIFKFKQFVTTDAVILEVVQRRKLKDDARYGPRDRTPTGHMEKVHTKGSYELDDCVGAFKVQLEDGTVSEINYGRGFPMMLRRQHWKDREELLGKYVEIRHLPHGASDGVRIGTLVGFRPDKD